MATRSRCSMRFPDHWEDTLYWNACLTALRGDLDGALRALKEAVDRSHWWSEVSLRSDPDLKRLHGDVRFEARVATCRPRHARAEADARPTLLVLRSTTRPPWPLMIALHGAGGRAEEFAEHWHEATTEGWLVGVPQSSQMTARGCFGWADRDRAAREIRAHYETITRDHLIDRERVIVAGFSQGGATAILTALGRVLPVRGLIGVACAPRDLDEVQAILSTPAVRHLRLYLMVGEKDYVLDRAREFCAMLKSARIAVHLDVRPGLGHQMPPDFARTLSTALAFVLG